MNLFAEAVQGSGLTKRQAEQAKRLFSSVEGLELSGVWVLVYEFVVQEYFKHVYGEREFSTTTIAELEAIIALKAWTPEGRESYLRLASPDPNRSQNPEIGIIPNRWYPGRRRFGPPTFLEVRLRTTDTFESNFFSLLLIPFSHLIGNPFDKSQLTSRYFPPEMVKRFAADQFKGMTWQDILVWEHIG